MIYDTQSKVFARFLSGKQGWCDTPSDDSFILETIRERPQSPSLLYSANWPIDTARYNYESLSKSIEPL